MRSTNRVRTLIMSGSVILMAIAIVVGMTWALFTDTQKVTNHLRAGDLSITLKRTELTKTTLNTYGYIEDYQVQASTDKPVTFSKSTDKNVFDIGENEVIVPGCKYVAKMKIENNSDVAFGYWIGIDCADKTQGANLAKQLKVTVNTGSDSSAFVNDGLLVRGTEANYIEKLTIGASAEFTVTVEFLDSFIEENNIDSNNLAQGESLSFDLVVYAVQVTE